MPLNLFGSGFSPVKSSARRRSLSLSNLRREFTRSNTDLAEDFDKIQISLGGQKVNFEDGEWIPQEGHRQGSLHSEVNNLKRENSRLYEENNLLKLKVEILLDMVTEKAAMLLIKDKELNKLIKDR